VGFGDAWCQRWCSQECCPGSSGAMGPRVSKLYLPGSPIFMSPPINWRRVGDEAGSACSWVIAAERLLHDMLASID
jgi:hypothetical protein